jgi:hypothetical protein
MEIGNEKAKRYDEASTGGFGQRPTVSSPIMQIVFDQKLEAAVEALAKILHESGREAVEKRLVYRTDVPYMPFCEWPYLPEPAREGRRVQARFLIANSTAIQFLLRW